ncbi:hypothetical protein [Streptomyces sp. NPDC001286]
MDIHLDYVVADRHALLAANRVLAGDPVIQTITTGEPDALRTSPARRPVGRGHPPPSPRRGELFVLKAVGD